MECFRIVKDYRSGNLHKFLTVAASESEQLLVHAFVPPNHKRSVLDRLDLDNARLKWNQEMKRKDAGFKKRKYKYVTIMKIEG